MSPADHQPDIFISNRATRGARKKNAPVKRQPPISLEAKEAMREQGKGPKGRRPKRPDGSEPAISYVTASGDQRTQINFKVTPEKRQEFERESARRGLTMSGYIILLHDRLMIAHGLEYERSAQDKRIADATKPRPSHQAIWCCPSCDTQQVGTFIDVKGKEGFMWCNNCNTRYPQVVIQRLLEKKNEGLAGV